jgi:hypothetical protein
VPRLSRKEIVGKTEDVERSEREKRLRKLEGDLHGEARTTQAKLSSDG